MRIIENIENFSSNEPVILILGVFDGIHRGHRRLLDQAVMTQRMHGGEIVVCTFSNEIVKLNDKGGRLIDTLEERLSLLGQSRVQACIVQEFNQEFKNQSPQEFITLIKEKINPQHIVVGFDYHFGKDGAGNTELLKKSFSDVIVVDPVTVGDKKVSSSALREFVIEAKFEDFMDYCGRPYFISGTVEQGRQQGRENDTPTTNLRIPEAKVTPPFGVYAVKVLVDGKMHIGVANLGQAPTFEDASNKLEVHLLDFKQDIYGKEIAVFFYAFLRKIKKYDSPEELYAQIKKDIEKTRKILQKY